MPYPPFEALGVKVDGEYRQLSGNVLQIENEYYSYVRPKRTLRAGERTIHALARADRPALDALREAYWRGVRRAGIDVAGKVFVDKHPLNSLKLEIFTPAPRCALWPRMESPR